MTSLRDGVYAVLAVDTGSGGFLTYCADGTAGFFGSDAKPEPTGQSNAPWWYLGFDAEVAGLNPNAVEGVLRLTGYDVPQAGYVRLGRGLTRACQVLADVVNAAELSGTVALFEDTTTTEVILDLGPGALGQPFVLQPGGLLQQWATWAYTKTYSGRWP